MNNMPIGLKVEQWFTEEKDLPSEPTDDIFLVQIVDLMGEDEEEIYAPATFIYSPIRPPVSYDEWQFLNGDRCYAINSVNSEYNVVAWARVKLEFREIEIIP